MRALRDPKPPARIMTGTAATLFLKPLSLLPDAMRDTLLYGMMFSAGGQLARLAAQVMAPPTGAPCPTTMRTRGSLLLRATANSLVL